jgi:transcriptional/translational regulatory protein YebC/TACO1
MLLQRDLLQVENIFSLLTFPLNGALMQQFVPTSEHFSLNLRGMDMIIERRKSSAPHEPTHVVQSFVEVTFNGVTEYFQVITSLDQFSVVRGSLQEAGVPFDADISGPQLIPITTVKTDDEAMELNKVLTDKLLELDDVDAVYSNQK